MPMFAPRSSPMAPGSPGEFALLLGLGLGLWLGLGLQLGLWWHSFLSCRHGCQL